MHVMVVLWFYFLNIANVSVSCTTLLVSVVEEVVLGARHETKCYQLKTALLWSRLTSVLPLRLQHWQGLGDCVYNQVPGKTVPSRETMKCQGVYNRSALLVSHLQYKSVFFISPQYTFLMIFFSFCLLYLCLSILIMDNDGRQLLFLNFDCQFS